MRSRSRSSHKLGGFDYERGVSKSKWFDFSGLMRLASKVSEFSSTLENQCAETQIEHSIIRPALLSMPIHWQWLPLTSRFKLRHPILGASVSYYAIKGRTFPSFLNTVVKKWHLPHHRRRVNYTSNHRQSPSPPAVFPLLLASGRPCLSLNWPAGPAAAAGRLGTVALFTI